MELFVKNRNFNLLINPTRQRFIRVGNNLLLLVYMEIAEKIQKIKSEIKQMESTAILFVAGNPNPFFVRQFNVEKQAIMEMAFSEKTVPSPEQRKEAMRYVC